MAYKTSLIFIVDGSEGTVAMKQAGLIALVPYPFTDLSGAKLRPVLLLRKASHRYDDWLVCMVSSQLDQAETGQG